MIRPFQGISELVTELKSMNKGKASGTLGITVESLLHSYDPCGDDPGPVLEAVLTLKAATFTGFYAVAASTGTIRFLTKASADTFRPVTLPRSLTRSARAPSAAAWPSSCTGNGSSARLTSGSSKEVEPIARCAFSPLSRSKRRNARSAAYFQRRCWIYAQHSTAQTSDF